MNRIDRLFAIQTYLQSRRYVTAEAVSEKFGISLRTVYRDIKALCEGGIPVSFEAGRGYFIVKGYFLQPVSFSTEEAAALMLMEGATRIYADKSIQSLYASALTKIRAVLKGHQQDGIDVLSNSMGVQLPECMEASYAHLAVLQAAITAKHVLRIAYCNKAGEASEREIEPVGLQYYAMAWHLMAWCHLRGEYRDFRVSRIEAIHDTGQPFRIGKHLSLAELVSELPVAY